MALLKHFYFSFFIIALASTSSFSQSSKIKFGSVSMEEMQMTHYEKDSSADAVILYDKGRFNAKELKFYRHVRVKILKKTGTNWGNWTINTPYRGYIKAVVYNLKDNEIVEEKVGNDALYEEQVVEDFYVYKLFAPHVTEGTVIDISYSHPGLPNEWRFQERIPVICNELKLEISEYIKYTKTFYGFEPIETISLSEWKAEHVPAFIEEPYLSHYSNYITKFQFQVTSFTFYGRRVYLNSSWSNINSLLLNYSQFGGLLNSGFLNQPAKEIEAKASTTEEKINLAYKYIQDNMTWNNRVALTASTNVKNSFQNEHTGNSAEINLLLTALLEKVGVKSYPVVLSTRDNGFLFPHNPPSLNQLNYVVAYVNHEGTEMLLDATSKDLVPGVLPTRCLNGQGLLVHRDHVLWVDLNMGKRNIKRQFANVTINEDGSASAKLTNQSSEYGYLEWVEEKDDFQEDEAYIQHLESNFSGIDITNYEVTKDKENLKVTEVFNVDLTENILDLDNEVIFSPFFMYEYNENPFKAETRKYPVDLTYPSEFQSTIIVDCPLNYQIKSMPSSIAMKMQNGGGEFTFLSNQMGNKVQFKVLIKITQPVFTETEYLELKQFFSQSLVKVNESIVFTKGV
ncbi:hypothetical protein JMN32_19190 [Fulvivirga sp. 29W222]|uniref:DUF3857 domain-containing protein n=1 Tax=Fulvivirga marina TaxID=2494733 RepID=A0A937G0L8_9BACT|nr:hypothetical protein [Fulvivirga marina]MBL6448447.1 hypothetical protein [Fulvivirga marina]